VPEAPFHDDDDEHSQYWSKDDISEELLRWKAKNAAQLLRDIYFKSFAADAINIVVEWAFSNRYKEVFILDQKSRKRLGGTPPKAYYDTIPKRYTKLGLSPLPGWVEIYNWVPSDLKGRSITPNDGSREEPSR
jgi:hypothetical protein